MEMTIKQIARDFFRHDQNMPKSFGGKNWTRDRKWIIPLWITFEVSIRFYGYSNIVHNFFEKHQNVIIPYIGEIGVQILGILCGTALFLFNTVLVTIPACFSIYIFYKRGSLTGTKIEEIIKRAG